MEARHGGAMYRHDPGFHTRLRACYSAEPSDSSGDDFDLLKEEAGNMWEDWLLRLRATGLDASFAKVLVDSLKRARMSEVVAYMLLKSLCIRLAEETPNPHEVIRLCREFIDMHLKNDASLHEPASLALQRWEAALSV